MKKSIIFFISCFVININMNCLGDVIFDIEWNKAKSEYKVISKIYDSLNYDKYSHSYWIKSRNEIKALVNGESNINFLKNQTVSGAMLEQSDKFLL